MMASSKVKRFTLNLINVTVQVKNNSEFYTVLEVIWNYIYTSPLKQICAPYLNLFNHVKMMELWVVKLLSFLSYSRKSNHNKEPTPSIAHEHLCSAALSGAFWVEPLT